jgi:putative PIN family toxin of toxin-antitoxin system
MGLSQVVLDTNILVTALRSKRGASFKLISLIEKGPFEINLSVSLVFQYEEILRRQRSSLHVSQDDIADFLDYLCSIANLHEIYFLWRPYLPDPQDDMLLDLAVKAGCKYIVTYNKRDFRGAEMFGIEVVTAKEFLERIGALS